MEELIHIAQDTPRKYGIKWARHIPSYLESKIPETQSSELKFIKSHIQNWNPTK